MAMRDRNERQQRRAAEAEERRVAGLLQFTDLIAILMVAATAFSGYSTWRTATIADQIKNISERPYIGVREVKLDLDTSDEPAVSVDFRDFGHVPADGVRVAGELVVDGRQMAQVSKTVGIMSPQVPHVIFLHVPKDHLDAAIHGRGQFTARFSARYQNADQKGFCYSEEFKYSHRAGVFEAVGGTTRCEGSIASSL